MIRIKSELLDTASSHILLHPTQQYVTGAPHTKVAAKFTNGTHTQSIGSHTTNPGPVTISESIMRKTDLDTRLLGVAPFTQAGCEAHLTNTSANITKNGTHVLSTSKAPSDMLWTIDLTQLPVPAAADLAIHMESIQEESTTFSVYWVIVPSAQLPKHFNVTTYAQLKGDYCNRQPVHNTRYQRTAIAIDHLQEHRKNIASTRKRPTLTPLADITP